MPSTLLEGPGQRRHSFTINISYCFLPSTQFALIHFRRNTQQPNQQQWTIKPGSGRGERLARVCPVMVEVEENQGWVSSKGSRISTEMSQFLFKKIEYKYFVLHLNKSARHSDEILKTGTESSHSKTIAIKKKRKELLPTWEWLLNDQTADEPAISNLKGYSGWVRDQIEYHQCSLNQMSMSLSRQSRAWHNRWQLRLNELPRGRGDLKVVLQA